MKSLRPKCIHVLPLAVLLACSVVSPAAAEIAIDQVSSKLSVAGSWRTRWEGWNWFEPSGTQNNDYDFIGSVARLGARWKEEPFEVFVEAQNSALIDMPTTASAPAPQGVLGLGGVYFAHNRTRNDASVFLKQGFVQLKKLGLTGLSARLGRFEFAEGSEVMTGDPTVDWLKNMRVAQRLIGSFAWSHVGRSFDGAQVTYAAQPFHFTAMVSHPTQGGFDLDGMEEIDDIDLGYGALSYNFRRLSWTVDARAFYVYYADRRYQVKSDNRPMDVRTGEDRRKNVRISTEGAHLAYSRLTPIGTVDGLLWGAFQQGDWGELDHLAWAWDAELGWQPKLAGKPWLRVGATRGSGDDDPADDNHDTFFQILPTARLYSFSTYYNMMNNTDVYAEAIFRPIPGLLSRTAYHWVRATEGKDLWYQGSGATIKNQDRAVGFGYPGRPAAGDHDLFQIVETTLSYDWSSWLNTNLYYGHLFGGAVVSTIFDGHDADFGYLEFMLKF